MPRTISLSQKATRAHTREHNKRLVLKTIYDTDQISRADAARRTGLTRASISNVVAELIQQGLVREVGVGEKTIGKPPTLLSVDRDAFHVLSLDLADGAFRGCILDLRGEIRHERSEPQGARTGEAAFDGVCGLIEDLIAHAKRPLLGVGIGTPGVVDPRRGRVTAINLDWKDLPLQQRLQERFDLGVHLANDSQVAALAQYLFDENENARNLILVKAGRGIGAGIVLEGQIFFGDGFGAGEIGHVVVAHEGAKCTCGHYGCLEAMAGSGALAAHAQRDLCLAEPPGTRELLAALRAGESPVANRVAESGRFLGTAIAHLIGALNIRHIFVAGDLAAFGDALLGPIRDEVKRCSLPALAAQIEIRLSQLGDRIVTKGAAALVMNHELGVV